MSDATFYRQLRRDGGVRTGFEIGDSTILGAFVEGNDELDPVLDWFIDFRFGGSVPDANEADEAREWLLEIGAALEKLIRDLAAELRVGIDSDWPILREWGEVSPGLVVTAAVSASKRVSGREIAAEVEKFASDWKSIVESLGVAVEA